MTTNTSAMDPSAMESSTEETVDWTQLGQRMWSFLTGREAAIHYRFEEMAIEVPRDTGSNAPRATWKIDGTLTITTTESAAPTASGLG